MRQVLAIFLFLMDVLVVPKAEAQLPDKDTVQIVVSSLGLDIVPPELISVEELELEKLPWKSACVLLMDSVPATEIVLIEIEESWVATSVDKVLVEGNLCKIGNAIRKNWQYVESDPLGVAADLVRLLVDPDPGLGVLLRSSQEIPVSLRLSDVYRDKESHMGKTAAVEAIREAFPKELEKIAFVNPSPRSEMVFYSWQFFGGVVSKWTLSFGKRKSLEREILAVQVGSWKLLY